MSASSRAPPDSSDSPAAPDSTSQRSSGTRRRLLAVLVLAVVPWSVQTFVGGGATFVFPWGLLTVDPLHVTTLADFLLFTQGLPDYILAWPLGVACYLVAVGSVAVGAATGREDARLTAVALVLAGVTQLELARGFSTQPGRVAWPLGALLLWGVAWYVYRWPVRPESGDGDGES
ncbi:TIGR04206 family protein [Halogranum amylolyticum]|uniref:TIGR04206 family protein n=1 Tax=Halogranum amylolyticum TaxID=660520 RepID=A0A1H8PAC2_9EURY|nr:TIGR04206 family protein [Halogranum amylolyticum]SEO38493.1 TIGR04206 family protein [Halogranum amylolyticum]